MITFDEVILTTCFHFQLLPLGWGYPFTYCSIILFVLFNQGVLCDCEIGVVIFNKNNGKLFEYSSVPLDQILHRYATYSGPSERRKRDPVGVCDLINQKLEPIGIES